MSKLPGSAVFTVRDLNRQPGKVLDAVRKFGSVEIRTRNGETFTIAPKTDQVQSPPKFPDFAARWKNLRELGLVPPPPSEDDRINRIIAGEA
jgi:hypothetical protein